VRRQCSQKRQLHSALQHASMLLARTWQKWQYLLWFAAPEGLSSPCKLSRFSTCEVVCIKKNRGWRLFEKAPQHASLRQMRSQDERGASALLLQRGFSLQGKHNRSRSSACVSICSTFVLVKHVSACLSNTYADTNGCSTCVEIEMPPCECERSLSRPRNKNTPAADVSCDTPVRWATPDIRDKVNAIGIYIQYKYTAQASFTARGCRPDYVTLLLHRNSACGLAGHVRFRVTLLRTMEFALNACTELS
jgi:hypothetical protein